jgi:hypothetical protein
MSAEIKKEIALEIAQVLFIDIVAYSKMATDDQRAVVETPNPDRPGNGRIPRRGK